ncbi:MAG: hypothetical protein KBF57_05335 [Saprospiraceae bacterium]|jgi:cytochrome bd-type quinol oxidase subunit 2|nr:hypothetical protein [Saprospiraceae bacterium]
MKNNLLYIAMFLMVISLPFRGNEIEVRWLWADKPWIPLVFICSSLMCVGLYLLKKDRISKTNES